MKHILSILILAALASAAFGQGRPRIGEAVYDAQGRLVHADPPCVCGPGCNCGPGCRCEPVRDDHVHYRSQQERKAFLIWIWNRRDNRPQQAPPQTDPAVLQALNQLVANQNRLADLVAQLSARPQQAPQPAPAPQIILLNPYQQLQPEARPRQDLSPEPRPRQDLAPEPRPRQDLAPEPRPRQEFIPDPQPRQQLAPGQPRQQLSPGPAVSPGQGKPLFEAPGQSKPGGYQTFTRQQAPVVRAIWPVPERR